MKSLLEFLTISCFQVPTVISGENNRVYPVTLITGLFKEPLLEFGQLSTEIPKIPDEEPTHALV